MKNFIKKNLKLIIVVIGVTILVEVLILTLISNINDYKYMRSRENMSEADKYYYDNQDKVNLEMGKYVESKDYLLSDGNILVEVINKNDFPGTGKIYVEFFDEKNESITMQDDYFDYIGPSKKTYVEVHVNDELKKVYKTYKIKVVLSYNASNNIYHDENKVKFISLDKKKGILTFKNDTGKKLELVHWGFLYYDEQNNLVDYSSEYNWDVRKGKKVKEKTYLKSTSYSKIKPVLIEAYSKE